ncbi:MFS transporter [Candidatus Methylospira mobilis]|uniref:MFS transporter n=2 Tax=Candidatus Methylospira mobilis TaxID=1808979 RepID=A0A5Q0BN51_9GAMM|nr:MFS transporter [Candidatus Methylospira mobilis]
MSRAEIRASLSLAGIYMLRMLGLFMILPVFSIYARTLEGSTPLLTGLAISAYGLTQAIIGIPFGIWSDRYGRKKLITIGLIIFALGSVVAALSESIYGVIAGRALQGSGAVAAVVMALAADLTREEHRTKAMALIGVSIGISFAISMVAGPVLDSLIGVPGMFWLIALLALAGIAVLYLLVPNPIVSRFHRDTQAQPARFRSVLANGDLLRLDFGIFALHAILTATFVVIPLVLRDTLQLETAKHWQIYLPVFVLSMFAMVPFVIIAEKNRKMKAVFITFIGLVAIADAGLMLSGDSLLTVAALLFVFFTGFNLLEATLPSMISKTAPADLKGTAMGIYSTSQFLGAFVGGISGGFIQGEFGIPAVFLFCALVALLWLLVALGMKPPRHLSSLLINLGELSTDQAHEFSRKLLLVPGVEEAVVLSEDGVAYLKTDKTLLDKEALQRVLQS